MEIYLVGGYVRDKVLGVEPKDKDYLVVGATVEEMLAAGYKQVGADFPVFLNPKTRDEYALARTERKSGNGHKGFVCDFAPTVSLDDDLIRRDLTINAIAMNPETNEIFDPLGGVMDLNAGILRHCSDAFAEDPLRVFRIARFAAQFSHLGFRIAEETMQLITQMVSNGDVNHLTADRVWYETVKALRTSKPSVYFDTLRQCGALKIWFPEIDALVGVPQPAEHHPEIDTYIHVMMCVDLAAKEKAHTDVIFGVLVHDLGKGVTPNHILPRHIGHEEAGVPLVHEMARRLNIPNMYKHIGIAASRYHLNIHTCQNLNYKTLTTKLVEMGAIGKTDKFIALLDIARFDARGRLGLEDRPYPQYDFMMEAAKALRGIDYAEVASKYEGDALLNQINHLRYNVVKKFKESQSGT